MLAGAAEMGIRQMSGERMRFMRIMYDSRPDLLDRA